jgi:hypothetical protein
MKPADNFDLKKFITEGRLVKEETINEELNPNNLRPIFDKWLADHTDLIKDLKMEYGALSNWIEDLYGTPEFETMVQSIDGGTEDEQEYSFGWTDEKDALFYRRLKLFLTQLNKTLK